jgi:hypothetical protein
MPLARRVVSSDGAEARHLRDALDGLIRLAQQPLRKRQALGQQPGLHGVPVSALK